MTHRSSRAGFTIVELLLFLGIVGILGTSVVTLLVWTQDTRLTQRTAADVEQTGVRLLTTITRMGRRAEKVLDPRTGGSGKVLTFQMAGTTEYPTIFAVNSSGTLVMIQRNTTMPLTSSSLRVKNFLARNTTSGNAKGAYVSFTIEATIPTPTGPVYSKNFRAAVTLFPDDLSEAGGCGSCTLTGCVQNVYRWSYCQYEACVPTSAPLACK